LRERSAGNGAPSHSEREDGERWLCPRSAGPAPRDGLRGCPIEPDILGPDIDVFNAFYYVELKVSVGVQVVGVQVNYRPDTCPP